MIGNGSEFAGSPSLLVWLFIVVIVVGRFLVRELRERRIALGRIFLIPAVLTMLVLYLVTVLFQIDAKLVPVLAIAALPAIVVGSAIGLAVAHFTSVRLGDAPRTVFIRGSYVTVAIWVGALALRLVARAFVAGAGVGINILLTTALVMMLVVAFAVLRLRILFEARKLAALAPSTPALRASAQDDGDPALRASAHEEGAG